MKNFKLFKKTSLLLAVLALAVVLVIGTLAIAATEGEGADGYGEEYAAVQVSTNGKVNMKVYYSTLGKATGMVAYVDEEEVVRYTAEELEASKAGDEYCVRVPLRANQMASEVTIKADGANGEIESYTYSVKGYVADALANDKFAEHHDSLRALANWGAMAQTYFAGEGEVGTLPNENLYLRGTNPVKGVSASAMVGVPESSVVRSNDNTVFGKATCVPALNANDTKMNFYVPYTGEGTLTATVSRGGKELAKFTDLSKQAEGYKISVNNVAVTLYDDVYTVVVSDGTETCTIEYSMLNYLEYMVDNGKTTAMKELAASMYQFHLAANEVAVADCAHGGKKAVHWIAADANSACVRCNLCFAEVGHQAIGNSVDAYIPAATIQGAGTTGWVDITLMSDADGKEFVRLDNMWANRDNWGDINLTGAIPDNTITGRYMIVKIRVGTEGNASTYAQFYVNTNNTDKKNLQGDGGLSFTTHNSNEWHTVIIDLATSVTDPNITFAPSADGSYDITYISFRAFPWAATAASDDSAEGRYVYTYTYTNAEDKTVYETYPGTKLTEDELAAKVEAHADYALTKIGKMNFSAEAYVDIGYIAFSDTLEDVMTLVDTDMYDMPTYTLNASNKYALKDTKYYNTVDGSCAHFARDAKEHVDGNTYGYNLCAQCGEYEHSKTLSDSVKLYFSPSKISATGTSDPRSPRVHYNFGSKSFVSESDIAYFGFTGKDGAAQFIWNRTGFSEDQAYTMDVGNSKYLVLKMRLSNTSLSANFGISLSTTAESSNTFNALPVKNSTAGQWATYVIDLASVYGSQYGLDPESNTFKIDTLYFHSDSLESTTKVDIAYMAFVEGDWTEVAKIVDTDTALLQTVKSGASVVVDGKTGECVGGVHAGYSVKAVDGVYKYTCDACGNVAIDYEVSADATSAYWSAELLYRKATKTGQSPDWTSWTGKMNGVEIKTDEDGFTYLHLSDAETNKSESGAWGGWFLQQSTENATAGRYMVIKVRRSSSDSALTGLNFWITSNAGYTNTWAAGAVTVSLGHDNTWHTIVVDLAARCGDAYKADANGDYGPRTIHMRPFGSGSAYDNTTNETFDIAYMAFFKDLNDIPEIVKDETYEYSKTSTSSVTLVTATGACNVCSPAYVADNTDARGYRYECSACGKDFAIDYYTSGKGGTFNYNNGAYAGTANKLVDPAGFGYVSFTSTGESGTFFDYNTNTGNGGGVSDNAVRAGRFLVVKLKGNTAANVKFHVGTDDHPKSNSNYVGGSLGELTPTTMPKEWQVAVIDLAGLANYSLGGSHKIFFSSTTGGGSTVAQGAQVDIAYMALVSNIADIQVLAGDEAIMYYGNSFNNTPEVLDLDCNKSGHIYGYETATGDNGKTITYSCIICGDTHVQTVSNNVNYYADLNSMSKYQHNLSKNLLDADNGVLFNRYYGKGGNHINITGGGGAGSLTGSTYTTGKYIAMKYRVSSANVPADGNTNSINLNIATGDKKSGNGLSVSSALYVKNIEQDVWRVVLIDVSGNAQWTSDGSAQKIYMMITTGGNSDYTFDVAWVAVVDSVNEFKTLLTEGETYYDYGTGWSTANPKHLKQDGTCVSCVGAETVSGNTYTYTCSVCGKVLKTITLDSSVKKYMSANQLNTTAKVYYGPGKSNTYKYDDVNNVAYMATSRIQTIWQRMDHDMSTTQTAADPEQYSENVGNAKYLVIKARSSDEAAYIMFQISTTAKNCSIGTITEADFTDGVLNATKATYYKIEADGSTTTNKCSAVGDQYYHGSAMCGIYLMGKGQATGEWTTYVIDLETVADGFYEKVEGQDYYDVDTFYFHNAGDNDIAYVAFVEGGWAEIDALVEEDTVVQITGHGNSQGAVGKVVNVADGSLAE